MTSVGSNENKYLFSMALCIHFASLKIISLENVLKKTYTPIPPDIPSGETIDS